MLCLPLLPSQKLSLWTRAESNKSACGCFISGTLSLLCFAFVSLQTATVVDVFKVPTVSCCVIFCKSLTLALPFSATSIAVLQIWLPAGTFRMGTYCPSVKCRIERWQKHWSHIRMYKWLGLILQKRFGRKHLTRSAAACRQFIFIAVLAQTVLVGQNKLTAVKH